MKVLAKKFYLSGQTSCTLHDFIIIFTPEVKGLSKILYYKQNFTLKLDEKVLFCPTVLVNESRTLVIYHIKLPFGNCLL